MYKYIISVAPDDIEHEIFHWELDSPIQLDKRILQLAGLVLDSGVSPTTLKQEIPTAQMYVDIKGPTSINKWIDQCLT